MVFRVGCDRLMDDQNSVTGGIEDTLNRYVRGWENQRRGGKIPACFLQPYITEGLLTLIAATAQLLRDMRTEVFLN